MQKIIPRNAPRITAISQEHYLMTAINKSWLHDEMVRRQAAVVVIDVSVGPAGTGINLTRTPTTNTSRSRRTAIRVDHPVAVTAKLCKNFPGKILRGSRKRETQTHIFTHA